MRTVEVSASYPATAEQVWDVAADLERWGEWLTIHTSWKTPLPDVVEPGSRFTAGGKIMSVPVAVDWTVVAIDAPSRVVMSGAGHANVSLELRMTLTENDEAGSTLHLVIEIDGSLMKGPLGGRVAKWLRSSLTTSLTDLGELVDR